MSVDLREEHFNVVAAELLARNAATIGVTPATTTGAQLVGSLGAAHDPWTFVRDATVRGQQPSDATPDW